MDAFEVTFFPGQRTEPVIKAEAISSLKPDLRISTLWVIALMVAAGVVLGLIAQLQDHFAEQEKMQDLALLVFLLTLLTWSLDRWQPSLGRWGAIVALVSIVYGG